MNIKTFISSIIIVALSIGSVHAKDKIFLKDLIKYDLLSTVEAISWVDEHNRKCTSVIYNGISVDCDFVPVDLKLLDDLKRQNQYLQNERELLLKQIDDIELETTFTCTAFSMIKVNDESYQECFVGASKKKVLIKL